MVVALVNFVLVLGPTQEWIYVYHSKKQRKLNEKNFGKERKQPRKVQQNDVLEKAVRKQEVEEENIWLIASELQQQSVKYTLKHSNSLSLTSHFFYHQQFIVSSRSFFGSLSLFHMFHFWVNGL